MQTDHVHFNIFSSHLCRRATLSRKQIAAKATHAHTQEQISGLYLLTYSQLLPKDGPLAKGRAVPPSVAKLILALVDAQLSALPNDDDGIWAALADGALSGGQAGDLVADDVSAQSHD